MHRNTCTHACVKFIHTFIRLTCHTGPVGVTFMAHPDDRQILLRKSSWPLAMHMILKIHFGGEVTDPQIHWSFFFLFLFLLLLVFFNWIAWYTYSFNERWISIFSDWIFKWINPKCDYYKYWSKKGYPSSNSCELQFIYGRLSLGVTCWTYGAICW